MAIIVRGLIYEVYEDGSSVARVLNKKVGFCNHSVDGQGPTEGKHERDTVPAVLNFMSVYHQLKMSSVL